jgi:anthranilate/para-aminobenzoate synthase component I
MQPAVYSERWGSSPANLDIDTWFASLGESPCVLLHGEGRWSILGEDPLRVLREPDPAGIRIERTGALPPILPDFLGFVGYEYGRNLEPLIPAAPPPCFPFPDFQFALHRRMRVFDRHTGILYEALREGPRLEAPSGTLLQPGTFHARKTGESDGQAGFEAKVQRIREEIASGQVYQVNLTRQERWAYEGDLRDFALRLAQVDPAPYSAFLASRDFAVISASPESFLSIREGRITTRPIKGTAPRGANPSEDESLARGLMASTKNRSELAMITDLLRNDLTRVCRIPSVRVDAFPELESYARVHHLVATLSGELKPGLTLKELLRATFPGGSITGCPKLAAMTLIHALEPQPRCVYTGALGWFSQDLSQLELSVAIRTAWASEKELCFGVGGGIVWDSQPHDEYLETLHKGASLLRCLN